MRAPLIILEEAASTQQEARRRLPAGEAGPLWVMARRQSAGHGRQGRRWLSPQGNLAVSAALREAAQLARLPQLSFVAALAAHKAARALLMAAGQGAAADALALKWPNDLLLFDRKLAGILLEAEPSPQAAEEGTPVVIGWGVNLARAPRADDLRWPAISLADVGLKVPPEAFLAALRDHFARWHGLWRARGFAPVRAAWLKRAWGLGRPIALSAGAGERHEGILRGMDAEGALLLEKAPGRVYAFPSGEVSSLRPA